MGYTYTPTYYSSLQDSITSLCKSILPFSFKKQRLTAAEQKFSKKQSDNLKWQQDSFHQILKLMGLYREGILPETEVSAFRSQLLETLIAFKGAEQEQPLILRDKLLFLQELLYAKCISAEEYHASKRPLLQRLAVQGAEIEARDVIVGDQKENSEEEWSVIDLRDDQTLLKKENSSSKYKPKHGLLAIKHIKDAASVFGFGSSQKQGENREQRSIFDTVANNDRHPNDNTDMSKEKHGQLSENPSCDDHKREKESETEAIFMSESLQFGEDYCGTDESKKKKKKKKKKAFHGLFHEEGSDGNVVVEKLEEEELKTRKLWGFDGFKKWKRNDMEDETAPLPLSERSSAEGTYVESCKSVARPIGEGPDTKLLKTKLNSHGSSSDFFIDKVVGDKIKKELLRIQTELSSKNPNFEFSNDQMDAISTKLPVDKGDLKQFFPKSWCDRYGDVVLNVVKKEFKEHVGEMENMRNATMERRHTNSKRWTTFEEDENCHPNVFSAHTAFTSSVDDFGYGSNNNNTKCLNKNKPPSSQYQNPFWDGSSMLD